MTNIERIIKEVGKLTDEKIEASTPLRDTGLDSFDLTQLACQLDLPNAISPKDLANMSIIDFARILDDQDPLLPVTGPVS
jgi:hypothetical protein